MAKPTDTFEHVYHPPVGSSDGERIAVRPLDAEYVAQRLNLTQAEADALFIARQERQRLVMPRLIGEYVINGLGCGPIRTQLAHLETIEAHRQALGLPVLVYGGYRAIGFLREGRFFGAESSPRAAAVARRGQFYAAQVRAWRDDVGYRGNNPFYYMTRDEFSAVAAPAIVGYAMDLLEPGVGSSSAVPSDNPLARAREAARSTKPAVTSGTSYWRPRPEETIETAARIVYHQGMD